MAASVMAFAMARVAPAQDITAVLREGVYADSDRTQVYRTLVAAQALWSRFSLSVNESVDAITSASTDVRSSPFIDATTGASARRQRAPSMADGRTETNAVFQWRQGDERSS